MAESSDRFFFLMFTGDTRVHIGHGFMPRWTNYDPRTGMQPGETALDCEPGICGNKSGRYDRWNPVADGDVSSKWAPGVCRDCVLAYSKEYA